MGDILWYMNITSDELSVSFEDLVNSSLSKINRKYPKEDVELNKLIRGES